MDHENILLQEAIENWSSSVEDDLERTLYDDKRRLITSALPYVNNIPHLGNIIGSVLSADVYARFSRLRGYNTLYICGTDEYGTATETKALSEGSSPQTICNKYFKIHSNIYKWFNISFDNFGRSSSDEHIETCQEIYLRLKNNGCTFKKEVEQLFCENCDRFLADRFVEGACPFCNFEDARGDQCDSCGKLINAIDLKQPKCKLCQNQPKIKESTHIFLDLPKLELIVKNWFENVAYQWSSNAKMITESWFKDKLKPRCISRDLKWGIPVPEESNKVFYVWFDAPICYISLTKNLTSNWKSWWMNEQTELYQFMAKDNVPFHSIMFPACLLATQDEYITVKRIFSTEYLTYENKKFSKSRGVGIFGTDLLTTNIPVDIWRFYLLYIRPETQDSNFSWDDFVNKVNSELNNNFGNFVIRSLKFLENNFESTIQEMTLTAEYFSYVQQINVEISEYIKCVDNGEIKNGLKKILSISRIGNSLIQNTKPWEMIKKVDEKQNCGCLISLCCNIVFVLAVLLEPYLPQTADTIITKQLNYLDQFKISSHLRMVLKPGHKIGQIWPLFKKIDENSIKQLKVKYG